MKKVLAVLLLAAGAVAAPCSWGEDKLGDVTDMQALRNSLRTDERAFVAATMKFSDAEAKKFWPIYDNYQRTVLSADRRRTRVLEDVVGTDRPLNDVYAKTLANELIAADDGEMKARRTLQSRLLRALPPRKVARFMQLESKIRAVEAYDIAAAIPLVK